jgi:hypothetical protein
VVREIPAEHDHVAVVGDNRKLVIFSLSELPILAKGQGVTLQRYRDGGLADVITLKLEDGLSWKMGGETGRTRTEKRLAACGRLRAARRADAAERISRGITSSDHRDDQQWKLGRKIDQAVHVRAGNSASSRAPTTALSKPLSIQRASMA